MPSPTEQMARPGRLSRWIPVVAVVAVAVALAAILLLRSGVPGTSQSGSNAASTVVPANWQTFSDKLGLFTLRLPPGWSASGGAGVGPTVGNRSGSETLMQEGFHFTDPSEGTASAAVYINANPIKTSFDHQWFCQGRSQETATFHGFPAEYFGNEAAWSFVTGNASFQFDVTIPGIEAPINPGGPLITTPPPTATPLPAAWIATDQTDVHGILASFQPTSAKPLAC